MLFLSMDYSTSVEYVFVCVRRGGVLPTKHNRPTFHRAGFCMEMNVQGAFIFRIKILSSKGYFIPYYVKLAWRIDSNKTGNVQHLQLKPHLFS